MLRAGLHLDTRVQFLSEDFHSKTGKVAKSARAGRPRTRFSASVLRPNSQCLECPADPCRPPGRKGGLHLGLWRLDVSKGAATGVTWRMRSAVRSSDPPLDVQLLLLEARLPRYRVRVGRMPGCATDPGALSCAGHRRRNAPVHTRSCGAGAVSATALPCVVVVPWALGYLGTTAETPPPSGAAPGSRKGIAITSARALMPVLNR